MHALRLERGLRRWDASRAMVLRAPVREVVSPEWWDSSKAPDLNRRLRAEFIEGAEERFRKAHGRGLTDEELRRIIHRYPGDLPEQ
jgi:hypothetical protein